MPHDTLPRYSAREEIDPKQFGEFAKQRQELKNIFDPLAEVAARKIEEAIESNPDEIRERLSEASIDELPYGDTYLHLPPGLLEGKDHTLTAPPEVEGYDRREWVDDLINEYIEEKQLHGTLYEKSRYNMIGKDKRGSLPPEIPYINMSEEFSPEAWKKYETAYLRHREQGTEAEFYELIDARANGSNHFGAPADYLSFIYTRANLKEDNRVVENILVPVGEYGEEFAKGLSRATLFMIEALDTAIEEDAEEVTREHSEVLREHTARGAEEEGGVTAHSTILTIQEGILSIMQTVSLLTADKVPGYDDPAQLLHDIIDQGMIEKVARMMPTALIGPITLQGKRFPHPIEVQEDGSLALTVAFTGQLHHAHGEYWKGVMREKKDSGEHPKVGTGLTCPASGKGGGIGTLAKVLDNVYQTIAA